MATVAQRRNAQRQIARQLRAGEYQRSEAGRQSQLAYERLTGTPAGGSMGKAGWKRSHHTTLDAAIRHAESLPRGSRSVIVARGTAPGYDSGRGAWLTLSPAAAAPDWYAGHRPTLQREVDNKFLATPRTFDLVWQE